MQKNNDKLARENPEISVIIPIFNEEGNLHELNDRLVKTLSSAKLDYELIFVNDGSTDRSLEMIKEMSAADSRGRVKLIDFSRNFGHQTAITAGVDYALGSAVVVIDADLQDPPEVIVQLVEKWRAGFDVVYAVRRDRKGENWLKKATAAAFYRLLKRLTNVDIPLDTGDFRLMSRAVVRELQGMREKNRFVRGMVSWVGFNQTGISYERDKRFWGQTKYPFRKMLHFALDGVTSFSMIPLKLATYSGFLFSLLGFVFAVVVVVQYLSGITVQGWASLMTAILVIGGIQLLVIGLIGEYLGRVFEESKNRPLYIVKEIIGFDYNQSREGVVTYQERKK